jgi:hypothetical protein
MKKNQRIALFLLLIVPTTLVFSQKNHLGVNLRLEVNKAWKVNKKLRIEASQQLQLNPEFNRNQKKFGDIFNEINLFPDDDSDDDGQDDADDDETDNDDGITRPFGELNEEPYNVLWEWRSATGVDGSYKLTNWLRLRQVYTLNIRKNGDLRHSVQSQISIERKIGDNFELQQRIGLQYTSRVKKDMTIWEEDLVARGGFEWDFKKKHCLEGSLGVNGSFDEGKWEWDRLRADISLEYDITKLQSFEIGYRFQQTLDRKKRVSHLLNIGFTLNF